MEAAGWWGFREESGHAQPSNFFMLVWNHLFRESKYFQFEEISSQGKLCPGKSCVYMCVVLAVGNLIQMPILTD